MGDPQDRLGLIRVYNAADQCQTILRQLGAMHPDLLLPVGAYGAAYRSLARAVLFLCAELEGLKRDTGFDPSAGDPHLQRELPGNDAPVQRFPAPGAGDEKQEESSPG